jgi:hypothetical protein
MLWCEHNELYLITINDQSFWTKLCCDDKPFLLTKPTLVIGFHDSHRTGYKQRKNTNIVCIDTLGWAGCMSDVRRNSIMVDDMAQTEEEWEEMKKRKYWRING